MPVTTLMNDAINAGTLAPCPFCNQQFLTCFNGSGNPDTKAWVLECSSCAVSFHADNNETQEEVFEWWNTRALSTPNAPVETAIAQVEWLEDAARYFEARPTLGEDMAHWANVHNAEMCRKIAAILAVHLDEAAIRKDEREKCVLDLQQSYPNHAWLNAACAAIRDGGKQP